MDEQGEAEPGGRGGGGGEVEGEPPPTGPAASDRSRREFLGWASRCGLGLGVAGVCGPALLGARPAAAWTTAGAPPPAAGPGPAGPASAAPAGWAHAQGGPRGIEAPIRLGRGTEGRFGLMFKDLPAFAPPDELLVDLAATMVDPATATDQRPDLDNPSSPAGFTFLGQFIDHDMTLDLTPLDQQAQDPHAVVNFRTPRFDLDSIYGGGPARSPELYDPADPAKLAVTGLGDPSAAPDVRRRPDGTGFVADVRNDENLVVCQLHVAFLRFHNALVDHVRRTDGRRPDNFERARDLARWHFQWVIVHDYLPRTVGREVLDEVLVERRSSPPRARLRHYRPRDPRRPFMPVEFSGAAFRFGHSQVRPAYLMNDTAFGFIFSDPPSDADLHGSRPVPPRFAIDFAKFFDMPGAGGPPANLGRRIDTKLSAGLFHLPVPAIVPAVPTPTILSLPERNLRRGKKLGLPAGQDVARALGVRPLANSELGLGSDPGWEGKAPLWFYVLKEAELQQAGERLGDAGGRIVAEVVVGLLHADRGSYFYADGGRFTPRPPIAPAPGRFGIGDLLDVAQRGPA